MNNLKGNLLILTYGFLSYQFIVDDTQSIFVYLTALLIELIILVLLYIFSNHNAKEESKINGLNVLIGAFPILLFNYVIINLTSLAFDNIPIDYRIHSEYESLKPLFYYKTEIFMVSVGIIISYLAELWNIKKLQLHLKVVESKVIIQALKIWGLGALSIVIFLLIPSTFQRIAISFLPISRIILELVIDKRLKKKKKS